MKPKKDVHTLYFVLAMLRICKKYTTDDLIPNGVVDTQLKDTFNKLLLRIKDVEKMIDKSIKVPDVKTWHYEWTDRDYQTFGQIYAHVCEMDEQQREETEEFTHELIEGRVRIIREESGGVLAEEVKAA